MSEPPQLLIVQDGEPVSAAQLDEPLDYLFAQHLRQRQFCRALGEAADLHSAPPGALRQLANFLAVDMALHLQDEEEDLFPLLRRKAEAEDDIERVLGILSADHDADRVAALALQQLLEASAAAGAGPAAQPGLSAMIERFIVHKRRHIALENAVVLPIARLRLTADDLQEMAKAMAARRAA